MNTVVSLFDGISVGAEAIKRTSLKVDKYYSSEIDPWALKISALNHPEIIQLGCIKSLDEEKLKSIGKVTALLVSFPCQDTSNLGKRAGLKGERSGLFFEALRIHKILKPTFFIYENVVGMTKIDRAIISKELGVKEVMINSALVSGQCRKRIYWTNIPGVEQPKDKGIMMQDILTDGYTDRSKSHAILTGQLGETQKALDRYLFKATGQLVFREKYFAELSKKNKSMRFANMIKLNSVPEPIKGYEKNSVFRHANIQELEQLQTLPIDYTAGVSLSQRYKMVGNSYTCDVIAHILSYIPKG